MTSTDQSTPLSQPSKSCAIVQRISDSNLSVILADLGLFWECSRSLRVHDALLLSSMITVEKKRTWKILASTWVLRWWYGNKVTSGVEYSNGGKLSNGVQSYGRTHKILRERLGENCSCTKGLIFRFEPHALKYREAHRHTHTLTNTQTHIYTLTHTHQHTPSTHNASLINKAYVL